MDNGFLEQYANEELIPKEKDAGRMHAETKFAKTIQKGRYRHYKGNEYEVLGMAKHSESLEDMVVYRALYGEHGVWVRPASMWNEIVEVNGEKVPRFRKI